MISQKKEKKTKGNKRRKKSLNHFHHRWRSVDGVDSVVGCEILLQQILALIANSASMSTGHIVCQPWLTKQYTVICA